MKKLLVGILLLIPSVGFATQPALSLKGKRKVENARAANASAKIAAEKNIKTAEKQIVTLNAVLKTASGKEKKGFESQLKATKAQLTRNAKLLEQLKKQTVELDRYAQSE